MLSKQLVTIVRDVPHQVSLESLVRRNFDQAALKQLFVELEFDTLGRRVFGNSFTSAPARSAVLREKREGEIQRRLFEEPVEEKTIHDVPHTYQYGHDGGGACPPARRNCLSQPSICFDTETTGLNPRQALPLGIAFAWEPHTAWYVVCPDDPAAAQYVLEEFRPVFEQEQMEKIGHNLKYDLTLLKWHGIDVRGPLFDTMLAHSMKEPEMRHGLDYLSKLYLGYRPIPISQLIGERGRRPAEHARRAAGGSRRIRERRCRCHAASREYHAETISRNVASVASATMSNFR